MVNIIAGEKGEGKTKRLLEMTNLAGKNSDGNIVFIDDNNRHMYDLHYGIRFVETKGFDMSDQKVFFGFICGILSQDRDIQKIFIDGVNNIVKKMDDYDLIHFCNSLVKISEEDNVDFTMIISSKAEALPGAVQRYLI